MLSNQDLFVNLQNGVNEKFNAALEIAEEQLQKSIATEVDQHLESMQQREWTRNRDRIGEISKFCDKSRFNI